MATASLKKFDVKNGISVNGLPFVDQDRNVVLNNLTVQGTSTIVDTRTITSVDPIISLGSAGKTYTSEGLVGDRIKFPAEAFSDIAVGDAISYNSGDIAKDSVALVPGTTFFVVGRETDPTSSNYRTVQIASTQGGPALTGLSETTPGGDSWTLNPLRDLDQDLGIEFNYVSGTPKKGFFGYKDTTGHFTFLLDVSSYSGSSSQSDNTSSSFTGTKAGIEVKYAKLQPTSALTANEPALDIAQTWTSGSVTFTAIDVNITDTSSASASNLIDVSVSSSPKFLVRKDGALAINTGTVEAALTIAGVSEDTTLYAASTWTNSSTVYTGIDLRITETSFAAGSKLLNLYGTDARNFSVDAYGKIVNNSSFTTGGLETAIKVDVTDVSSASGSLLLDLQVGSTSRFSVNKSGDVQASGNLTVEGNSTLNGNLSVEDYVSLEAAPNGAGAYEENSRVQTSYVTIAAGSNSVSTISSFQSSAFVTAKYLVQIKQGLNYHSAEVLLLHNGSTVFMTEYGALTTSNAIGILDAAVSGGSVILTLTPTSEAVANNAQIDVRVVRTTIAD